MILCAVAPALLGLAAALVLLVLAAPSALADLVTATVLVLVVSGVLCVAVAAALVLRLTMSSAATTARALVAVWMVVERVAEYFPPLCDGGDDDGGEPEPIDVLYVDRDAAAPSSPPPPPCARN